MMRKAVLVLSALAFAACGRDAGAPTSEQNRQLDDAEQMLNEAPANLESIDDSALAEPNSAEPR